MDRLNTIGILALLALSLPLILVWVAVYLVWRGIWGLVLCVWFWRTHAAHGRRVLFVYSESPHWKTYIEQRILPRLQDRAVVLNWSERHHWSTQSPWEVRFFRRFAGDRDFNPLALVFCARGRVHPVRFHQAFIEFKHNKDTALRAAESELWTLVEP